MFVLVFALVLTFVSVFVVVLVLMLVLGIKLLSIWFTVDTELVLVLVFVLGFDCWMLERKLHMKQAGPAPLILEKLYPDSREAGPELQLEVYRAPARATGSKIPSVVKQCSALEPARWGKVTCYHNTSVHPSVYQFVPR